MRIPRVRFTVRRQMVAVAVVGLFMGASLWVVEMRTRSAAYRKRALEQLGMMTSAAAGSGTLTRDGRPVSIYDNENDWLRDAWVSELAEKYWRLSYYPWLPVAPGPPPPGPLAHPRAAVDCPVEMDRARAYRFADAPWWTFLWTWRPK